MGKNTVRIAQPRVTMGPVRLNVNVPQRLRRATRAELMLYGAPKVIGNDSTDGKEQLPGQWTLVEETNIDSREKQMTWRQVTSKTMDYLSGQLKQSLIDHPHPLLSKKAIQSIHEMKEKSKQN